MPRFTLGVDWVASREGRFLPRVRQSGKWAAHPRRCSISKTEAALAAPSPQSPCLPLPSTGAAFHPQSRRLFWGTHLPLSSTLVPAPARAVFSGEGDAARPRERFVAAAIRLASSEVQQAGGECLREFEQPWVTGSLALQGWTLLKWTKLPMELQDQKVHSTFRIISLLQGDESARGHHPPSLRLSSWAAVRLWSEKQLPRSGGRTSCGLGQDAEAAAAVRLLRDRN